MPGGAAAVRFTHARLFVIVHAPRSVIPIPFSITDHAQDPETRLLVTTEVNGLIRMEGDEVVLQYRVSTSRQAWGGPDEDQSDVLESRIALQSIRRVELKRGWFRTRVVLLPADLRDFGAVPGFTGTELTLTIPRAEREDAAHLVSSIELALSTRLLDGSSGGRSDPNPQDQTFG